MQRLPQPFDMIHPRRVNWLINHPELRVCFQPAQRFTAFVDDVLFVSVQPELSGQNLTN
ncbi:peptide ABC transporter permease [Escherichia coli]|nr:peptide ABC transporter permease [Escherichia coli]